VVFSPLPLREGGLIRLVSSLVMRGERLEGLLFSLCSSEGMGGDG
jgi:hypothetical protein